MNPLENELGDLWKRYEELEFVINKSPFVVFIWKNEENWPVEFVSENISQFGYTKDEFISGKIQYLDLIYQEDLDRVMKEVTTFSENRSSEFIQEYRILGKSKEILWIEDRTFVRRNPEGEITHFQGVILDITDKKKIQKELEKLEQISRMISE